MHRDDKSKYLLYIEPKKEDKLETPVDDNITKLRDTKINQILDGCDQGNILW